MLQGVPGCAVTDKENGFTSAIEVSEKRLYPSDHIPERFAAREWLIHKSGPNSIKLIDRTARPAAIMTFAQPAVPASRHVSSGKGDVGGR
jgi:hypothetical protein